ncbi:hypothetical protein [Paenibacillus hubeiensis]|uniref:hypothetical protein n=1 Tax=Paenibacillus hubeiensis TaxID=3077330 RepID=UPI0031BA2AFB
MWNYTEKMARNLNSTKAQEIWEETGFKMVREKHSALGSKERIKTLHQFSQIVDTEASTPPVVPLVKGQVIHANLIGLGQVLNDPHFVIVWSYDQGYKNATVIPLSSNKRVALSSGKPGYDTNNQFNLGVIAGLNNTESLLKINQMTTITLKGIKHTFSGNQVHLSPDQLQHVEDIFREKYADYTLLYHLISKVHRKFPTNLLSEYEQYLYRPVMHFYDSNTDILQFKTHEMSGLISLQLKDIVKEVGGVGQHNRLLHNLVSKESAKRKSAYSQVSQHFQTPVATV